MNVDITLSAGTWHYLLKIPQRHQTADSCVLETGIMQKKKCGLQLAMFATTIMKYIMPLFEDQIK